MSQLPEAIECFSMANCHLHGDALVEHFRFRYRCFIERRGFQVPSYRGMEYDQYDTPAARYINWRDGGQKVRGSCRIVSTTRPYMLAEQWPELVTEIALPRSRDVAEGSRFGVDDNLPARQRRIVFDELLIAGLVTAHEIGARSIICIVTPQLLHSMRERLGRYVQPVGAKTTLSDGHTVTPVLLGPVLPGADAVGSHRSGLDTELETNSHS